MRNGLCAQLAGLVVWRGALVSRNLQKRFAIVLGFDIYIYISISVFHSVLYGLSPES